MRIILPGNAGVGKSTKAHRIIGDRAIPRLSLDQIAWDKGPKRKPLEVSLRLPGDYIHRDKEWIIEGCYSDLVGAALPCWPELRFLNPATEVCVAHCHRRPWGARDDEYGLKRHRQVFDRFSGPKREYTSVNSYTDG